MALSHLAGSTLRTTLQETNVIRLCSFYVLLSSAKFVFVQCKYIPVRRYLSAVLVISPTDKIFVYTAMYVRPMYVRPMYVRPMYVRLIPPSVTRPGIWASL